MRRPLLHHTPASGWVNDPHALVHRDGTYHLFFQLVPGRTIWDLGCHWGHATSTDLLTWEPQPVALAPDADEAGIWSGNVVQPAGGGAVAFYTSVSEQPDLGRVRRAVPLDDEWSTWAKQDVVVTAPDGAAQFRDPFVYADGDGWAMLLGCATDDDAAVWLYRSPDLEIWEYAGVAASRPAADRSGVWAGRGWECPVVVDVDGRTVLLVSVWEPGELHYLAYAVCDPDGDELHPGPWQRLSYGPGYYAASTFRNADDRPGIVAWIRGVADLAADLAADGQSAGWAGTHSLPAAVALDGDVLVVTPPPALLPRRRPAEPGHLPPVADLEWAPTSGDGLTSPAFALAATDHTVTLTAGEHTVSLPWSGELLRLVVDGPVLELYGRLGILAVPLADPDGGPLTWTGAEPVVHAVA